MTGSTDREILTIEEAALLLGVSVKTFNKVLHHESIPARKIGREWKFSRQALIDWVGSGRSDAFYRESRSQRNGGSAESTGGNGGGNGIVRPQAASQGNSRQEAAEDEGGNGSEARRTSGWRLELD